LHTRLYISLHLFLSYWGKTAISSASEALYFRSLVQRIKITLHLIKIAIGFNRISELGISGKKVKNIT